MTYAEIRHLAVQQSFIDQVRVAIVTAAINISSEAPETENHANRIVLCKSVLHNPGGYAPMMAEGVAQDTNVQASASDSNIFSAVAGQWNAYSGLE